MINAPIITPELATDEDVAWVKRNAEAAQRYFAHTGFRDDLDQWNRLLSSVEVARKADVLCRWIVGRQADTISISGGPAFFADSLVQRTLDVYTQRNRRGDES